MTVTLSIPAKAATEDALDLSTKPGPEGMLALEEVQHYCYTNAIR